MMSGDSLSPSQTETRQTSTVGEILRHRRQQLGFNLVFAANNLRIRPQYIQALEKGDSAQLPGTTYAVGFIRSYATFLGLDGEEMVKLFKEEAKDLKARQSLSFPAPRPKDKSPSFLWVFLCVLALGLAYGGWAFWGSYKGDVASLIPSASDGRKTIVQNNDTDAASTKAGSRTERTVLQTQVSSNQGLLAEDVKPKSLKSNASTAAGQAPQFLEGTPTEGTSLDQGVSAQREIQEVDTNGADRVVAADRIEVQNGISASFNTSSAQAGGGEDTENQTQEVPNSLPSDVADVAISPATRLDEDFQEKTQLASVPQFANAQSSRGKTPTAALAPASASPEDAASEDISGLPSVPAIPESNADQTLMDGRQYGTVNRGSEMTILALEDSWIQVQEKSGDTIFTQLLRKGDRYSVPKRSGLTLTTGNAGGIEIDVDGQKISGLGAMGAVMRGISLDKGDLLTEASN